VLTKRLNGYFTFQTIIDVHGTCNWGMQLHLIGAALVTDVLFVQFLICFTV